MELDQAVQCRWGRQTMTSLGPSGGGGRTDVRGCMTVEPPNNRQVGT